MSPIHAPTPHRPLPQLRRIPPDGGDRPKALDDKKAAMARRLHLNGEPVSGIADALGVSRATVYRVLAAQDRETT
jgi:DNA invertase Pin-like site-specific DNA recombinase